MQIKNKKVLITGATGFIGANLARRFIQLNADVHILVRSSSDKWRIEDILNDVKGHCIDLMDYQALEKAVSGIKPDIIIHTAVYGGYIFQKDINKIMQVNIIGTVNLLNACSKRGFELFINTGTSSEYGRKNSPIKEDDALEATGSYGISKAAASLYCQAVAKSKGRPIITLRLFSPYGYYEEPTRLIPSVIISCLKDENPRVSSPGPVRDFIFIEDVVDAYVRAIGATEKAAGEIFSIGCGRQYSVGDVVSMIVKLTGSNVEPEWGSVPGHKDEPDIWQADIAKARDILKWEPENTLDEGLTRNIKWFRENVGLYDRKDKES